MPHTTLKEFAAHLDANGREVLFAKKQSDGSLVELVATNDGRLAMAITNSEGVTTYSDYIGGRVLPFTHDPEAVALLQDILSELRSVNSALGDVMESLRGNPVLESLGK